MGEMKICESIKLDHCDYQYSNPMACSHFICLYDKKCKYEIKSSEKFKHFLTVRNIIKKRRHHVK